ncbi:hypothetical protein CBR_g23014 [Chara braunii]|uniref:cyclic pyranopterin monophosphate synthase n=1 Tax=Chara braunii TaxID=69332 RepID=A0A388L3A8_CHABU|nr:hypothetical protein CBR_g23014 [Chara braunii]|eukprot:GBG76799.1 hypothetical protein CBR_g23014 [Chara braunii]
MDSGRLVRRRRMPCLAPPGRLLDQVQPSGMRMKAGIAMIAAAPRVIARGDCSGIEEQIDDADKKVVAGTEQAGEEGMQSVSCSDGLTHVDSSGQARIVDVSNKSATVRVACASATVRLGPKAFGLVRANQIAKGDVLAAARIAGISGAKLTSTLIPLCHNLFISGIDVELTLDEQSCSVQIRTRSKTTSQTGVEMEALTAASVAALTVYDMCKAVSKDIQITDVQLEEKSGGKSGYWRRGSPTVQK